MTPSSGDRSSTRRRGVVVGALALVVAGAAAVVVGSVATTAESRFAGATSNEGSFMSASAVDLSVGGRASSGSDALGSSSLAMDADNLVPGQEVTRCIQVGYSGGIDDVRVRMFGRGEEDSGLEPFLDAEVDIGTGRATDCADFVASDRAFEGSLDDLWRSHDDFASGLALGDALDDGESFTLRIAITLADDDRAQGLGAAFWLMFEVRP